MLESVTSTDLLITQTRSLTDSGVTADATIYAWNEDTACYFGQAKNLESNLLSVSKGGNDCNAVDGCGTHIHAGSDCFNSTTQEGDYYDQNKVSTDPWAGMGYLSTDSAGVGYFASCVETGATSLVSRAFIVHASNGSRVSCGLLDLVTPNADSVTSTGNPVTAIPDPLNSPATNNTNTADQSSAVAMRMIPTTAATVCAIAVWYVITWQLI